MRTIICTTGTSIFGDPRTRNLPTVRERRNAIRHHLEALREKHHRNGNLDQTAYLTAASAESNSLSKLNPTKEDEVVFLHSDTDDGELCAEELQHLLADTIETPTELRRIAGLQVMDAELFRTVGIQNLFAALDSIRTQHRNDPEHDIVLNLTGGFKSVGPYLTLYGLLYRLPIVYVFELSNTLITLPAAPIHFDFIRLAHAGAAINRLGEQGRMRRDDFFQMIPDLTDEDRPGYEMLVVESDCGEGVELSPFGWMMLTASTRRRTL